MPVLKYRPDESSSWQTVGTTVDGYSKEETDALLQNKADLDSTGKVPTSQLPAMDYAPSAHASRHATGGSDPITPADIGVYSKEETDTLLQKKIDASSGAGAHNSIYRGKYLGASVTAEQYAAIDAGTFDDLYIGDYWTIGDVNYRIAAFDYYYHSGNNIYVTTHHVTLVPDWIMYSHVMNDTNTTEGGYAGSKMNNSGLNQAVTTINNAFGSAHILTRREVFTNAVSNGKPSGGSWYDTRIYLMTEQNVYGDKVFGTGNDGTTIPHQYVVDNSQYPLFAFRHDLISNRTWYWLRDVVSDAHFAYVADYGSAAYGYASAAAGVRPAFSIKA